MSDATSWGPNRAAGHSRALTRDDTARADDRTISSQGSVCEGVSPRIGPILAASLLVARHAMYGRAALGRTPWAPY